jgi:putative mycofactocin binding protein MftB
VESIKREADGQEKAAENRRYALPPGVRVRREGFGLLFYNSKDAKLTFVRSGVLLEVSVDPMKHYRLTATREAAERERAFNLLRALVRKGLIHEA